MTLFSSNFNQRISLTPRGLMPSNNTLNCDISNYRTSRKDVDHFKTASDFHRTSGYLNQEMTSTDRPVGPSSRPKKRDSNVLKFHNFVPNTELSSKSGNDGRPGSIRSGHCLREEHGSKQINVCNWQRKQSSPMSVKSEKMITTLNTVNLASRELEPTSELSKIDLNSDLTSQSILGSLLAKQDAEALATRQANSPNNEDLVTWNLIQTSKVNRRKSSTVRRVLRTDEQLDPSTATTIDISQSEPLDLSTAKRRKTDDWTFPILDNSFKLPLTANRSTNIDYFPVILPSPLNQAQLPLFTPILPSPSPIASGQPTLVAALPNALIGSTSPTTSLPIDTGLTMITANGRQVILPRVGPVSMIDQQSLRNHNNNNQDQLIYSTSGHMIKHGTNFNNSNSLSSRTSHKSNQCCPVEKTSIKAKLENEFRTNGFLVKTKEVSDGEATFCKFRQLRKYTRYYLKSWHQHLPEEINKLWKGFLPPKTSKPSSSSSSLSPSSSSPSSSTSSASQGYQVNLGAKNQIRLSPQMNEMANMTSVIPLSDLLSNQISLTSNVYQSHS